MTDVRSGAGAEGGAGPAGGDARRSGRRRVSSSGPGGNGGRPGFGDGRRGQARGRERGSGADTSDKSGAAAPADDRDPAEVARGICLRALTGASKTRQQLAELLARRDIPEDVAETVLDRFTEVGLVDDAAFAAAWVRSRQSGRGLARRALAQELRAKGIDGDVAADAVAEIDPQDEWDAARRLVERKVRGMARLDRVTAERRLVGMLARKGYGGGLAAIVVREALDALAAETEDEPDVEPGGRPATDGRDVAEERPAGFGRGPVRRATSPASAGMADEVGAGMADEVGEGHWVGLGRFTGPADRLG
jgi:SOS response regulatory protein OraA/RecX